MSPDIIERVIADVEQRGISRVREKWGVVPNGNERREKYFDLRKWIPANLRRIQMIGLNTGRRRRVLDLGCGCGYFVYLCNLLGHEAVGIDRAERDSLFVDMRVLLGVRWRAETIRYPEPIVLDADVVTAHMVTFNGHRVKPWGPKEWEWLLGHAPKATWHIELNQEPDGTLFPPGVRELFVRLGARINGHRVLIA